MIRLSMLVLLASLLVPGMFARGGAGFSRPALQTRDAIGQVTTASAVRGTATVSGLVTSFESAGQPVRRATVSLFSADLRVPLSTTTDDSGRFVFSDVPAGNYGVVASKAAFIGAFHGSTRPGRGPGVPIAVRDGERIEDITLPIARGAVISGTVLLPSGLPAEGMTVLVTGLSTVGGARRPILRGGRSLTDDRGEYRVYGLGPGDYVVQVQPSGFLAGTPSGTTDARLTSASEVSWAQAVARSTTAPLPPDPAPGPRTQYAKVFHPGTTDRSSPRVVTVDLGEERTGIDVTMVLVPTARITGTVMGPDGAPLPQARLTLTPADFGVDALAMVSANLTIASGDDGSFELAAVEPGRYRLSMRRTVSPPPSAPAGPAGVRAGVRGLAESASGSGTGGELWAEESLVVDGRDLGGLTLVARPGLTVAGRLRFEASSMPPPTAADLAEARVTLVPWHGTGSAAATTAPAGDTVTASVSSDGSFRVPGIVPGRYRLTFSMPELRLTPDAPPGGWWLQSILAAGVDVLDGAFDVGPETSDEALVAVFTDQPSELVGSLTDLAGRPAPGYPIVVFAAEREYWLAGSRRVAVARPATDGRFQLTGLPDGVYYVCAVVSLDDADLADLSYLERLSSGALTVTLTAGARTTQDLQLAGGV